jgi:pilus assembly protein CpaB
LKRRLLTIVLAGLLAVVGAVAVLAYVGQANKRAIAGDIPVTVLAAKNPILGGTSLKDAKDQLITETVPAKSLSGVPGAPVTKINSGNENKVLSGLLGQGQLLMSPMLVTAAKRATSNVTFPSNKVAVTIALCIPEAVAGWVTAGSRVAVFDTYVPHFANQPPTLQRTCDVGHQAVQGGIAHTQQVAGLADLEVLSIGVASPGGPSASSALGAVQAASENSSVTSQGAVLVTLAVDPTVAWKLIQVADVGMPYLALNAPNQNPGFGNGSTLFP